jgi:hypothetical protein
VRLVIQTAAVARLFAIMGVDRMFPVFATLAEAVAGAPGHAPQPLPPHHTQVRPATG